MAVRSLIPLAIGVKEGVEGNPLAAGAVAGVAALLVLAVALAAATAFGVWRRRTDGRLRATDPGSPQRPSFPASDLGITLGPRATLLQFSSAFCQPFSASARTNGSVALLSANVDVRGTPPGMFATQ